MATTVTIARLNTLVTANAVQFVQEFNKVENVAKRSATAINGALGTIGLGVSAAGLVAFSKSVLDFGSGIVDMSRQAGMGQQAFQTLSGVAAESGVQMEQVAKSSETLRSKLQEAADGSATVRDELRELNLTVGQLQSLAPERQWETIARAINNADDKQKAFNIASDLFGSKNAPKLREVLERLATDGYDKLSDAMKGIRIPDATLKTLDDAGDKLTNIWTKVKAIGAAAAGGILGAEGGNGKTFMDSLMRVLDHGFSGGGAGRSGFDMLTGRNKNFAGDPGLPWQLGQLPSHNAFEEEERLRQQQLNDNAKSYAKSHPFDSLYDENNQDKKIDELLNSFFGRIDEKAKQLHSSKIEVEIPQASVDRLTRIGLLTGKNAESDVKKQTNLLSDIKQALREINAKTTRQTATASTFN